MVWDRQDWIGLVLFGTEIWDKDPETKHILTLQKLGLPSRESLKEIMKIGNQYSAYIAISKVNYYTYYKESKSAMIKAIYKNRTIEIQ